MSVVVRLALIGKKGQPLYRVVVCEKRSKRNGRCIDLLGHYNPSVKPPDLKLDEKKLKDWQAKGAVVSSGLFKLLKNKPV